MSTSLVESDKKMDLKIPHEIQDRVKNFHESIINIETIMKPMLSKPHNDLHEKLLPIEKAKMDLMVAYTVNSMFWMFLNASGENTKEHPVKQELERLRGYMHKVKQIVDKEKAARLDKDAAKRFVKHALWEPKPAAPVDTSINPPISGNGRNTSQAKRSLADNMQQSSKKQRQDDSMKTS
ncbi:PREDICTED: nuclear nucleic acid-binding protein C1D-like [Priapulus caudatus]|uniref:Nuclear nucleic acid-binding protein C1D n=1 Tax=Priapulus caudatus TaxID=37621 RepID=A0ABM1EP68_PRICU|nr:PREDICTED: nuclear nucleic acid-binding protein C1D-like [Priapulus caudatus]